MPDSTARDEATRLSADPVTERTVRTMTENARTLKFDDGTGFDEA